MSINSYYRVSERPERGPSALNAAPPPSAERRFSGHARLALGFVAGALFALTPMYYYFKGKEAALREAAATAPESVVPGPLTSEPPRGGQSAGKVFASRMTYELSRLPEEPIAVVAKAPAVPIAAPEASEESARVENARPISAIPLKPGDRTAAIEREGQQPQYREVPRAPAQAQAQAPAPQPRVIEGREVQLKGQRLPETPTRPIVADASVNNRAEIEAERSRLSAEVARAWPLPAAAADAPARKSEARTAVALAQPVAGATPITRAPEAVPRKEAEAKPTAPAALAGDVENRLVATREWLAAAPQTTHTIQIMGANSEDQLKGQLKALSKTLEPSKLFVFRTVAQGKPSITLVYGAYEDKRAALQALEKLPPSITANKPVLRTVNGIRAEMKQHKTDS